MIVRARSQAALERNVDAQQRLVSEVLAKDRKATAEFVALCADCVYSFVLHRLTPRRDLAEDVMQEILIAAWQNLPKFRGDCALGQWLLGIARHKVEDYYRKRIREALQQPQEEFPMHTVASPEFEQDIDAAEQGERVQNTLALLPEPYRIALMWRYRDGRSVREIAQSAGKTEKAVERLLARARENFRRRWNDARS